MKIHPRARTRLTPLAALSLAALLATAPAHASDDAPKAAQGAALGGLHAFDLRMGEWRVHNRRLKERLAHCHEWVEFEGTQRWEQMMDGRANVDDNVLNLPGGTYRGVTLRAYDPKTGQWAIWWLDGRNPLGELDPPVVGHFENGVGTFYANDTLRGKPIIVRFIWSQITATSAHWEQAFSPDGGKTWETNWISDFSPKE
jgi:hypothetical protein